MSIKCLALVILSLQLTASASAQGSVKQSASEVHLHRRSRATWIETFDLCGFGNTQWHLKLFKSGTPGFTKIDQISINRVPAFDSRVEENGVSAMLWDTNNNECHLLVVRVWPSILSENCRNVSVVLNRTTQSDDSSDFVPHKIDFLFHEDDAELGSAITSSEGLTIEVSTSAVELDNSSTIPRIVTFRYNGTEAESVSPKILCQIAPSVEVQLGSDVVLNYEHVSDCSGMAGSIWNSRGRHVKEVAVAVWPQALSRDANFTLTLHLVYRASLWPHSLSLQSSIDFYYPASVPTSEADTTSDEGSTLAGSGDLASGEISTSDEFSTKETTQTVFVSPIDDPFIQTAGGISTITVAIVIVALVLITVVSVFVTRRCIRKREYSPNSAAENV